MITQIQTKYTEMTLASEFSKMIDKIIEKENLPLFGSRVEVVEKVKGQTKRVDLFIYSKIDGMRGKIICVMEFKLPTIPLWSFYEDALSYAHGKGIPFFSTCNINRARLFATSIGSEYHFLSKQKAFDFCDIKFAEEIENPTIRLQIEKGVKNLLHLLVDLLEGKEILHTLRIDEGLVLDLRDFVETSFITISRHIFNRYNSNKKFRDNVKKWFSEQGLEFHEDEKDFDTMARQYAYLLIDKILFYDTLRSKFGKSLDEISIPETSKGEMFSKMLNVYFEKATEDYDYETVFGMNFVDRLSLPDGLVKIMRKLIKTLNLYDFSSIKYETLGNIYEKLIPRKRRHYLGQYFTNSEIVDLILGFTLKNPDDKVIDPACGAGTFLVRAYHRLKYLNPDKTHHELLNQLYGIDIAKFPAHLSTINLVIRDLTEKKNYPRIVLNDFFDTTPDTWYFPRHYRGQAIDESNIKFKIPKAKVVVGNPPYTRQEELEELGKNYKDKLRKIIKAEWEVSMGKRSGIYSYFFLHGTRFLEEGGKFGFITSNSWLDVDYGKYIQEFLLRNSNIIAIIGSKVERWFEDASINTVITIFERLIDIEIDKRTNFVKFVQLKRRLEELIPKVETEEERWKKVEELADFVENCETNLKFEKIEIFGQELLIYEDEDMRILMLKQRDLWYDGYDNEKGKYVGSKWSKYLIAPEIFFDILKKGKDLFVPLREEVAEVKRGFTTGVNAFFYLTEEEIKTRKIEKEFWCHKKGRTWVPNYVIKSPRECKRIVVEPEHLKYRVLMIHKDKKNLEGTNILKYIDYGERKGFHTRPTCRNRDRWYDLGKWKKPDILWPDAYNVRYVSFSVDDWADKRFFYIYLREKKHRKIISAYLNSSIIPLFIEIEGIKNLGEGAVYTNVYWLETFLIVPMSKISNIQKKRLEKAFDRLSEREIESIFDEIGASTPEDVTLGKIKPDRRELDRIVMGEILKLTEVEQLEVYKAVVDLVRSRIETAGSIEKTKKKTKKKMDVSRLAQEIANEIDISDLKRLPNDYEIKEEDSVLTELPRIDGIPKIKSTVNGFFLDFGIAEMKCQSMNEARYFYYACLCGNQKVLLPKDEKILRSLVFGFQEDVVKKIEERARNKVENYLVSEDKKEKLLKLIERNLWRMLSGNSENALDLAD